MKSVKPYQKIVKRENAPGLVREGAIHQVQDQLEVIGYREEADALSKQATEHTVYLERCLVEANAVLGGDLGAATRLWLLLNEPICDTPALTNSVRKESARRTSRVGPSSVVHEESLSRLVAGIVRAANHPAESDSMLDALGRLLEPLLVLESAAAAAAQRDDSTIKTLFLARSAPMWRAALTQETCEQALPRPPVANEPLPIRDRIPFNVDSWSDPPGAHPGLDERIHLWNCASKVRLAMSQIDRFGPRYTIESLSNAGACPGEQITIRGHGFGPRGRVYFPIPDPDDPAFQRGVNNDGILLGVAPKRWTDTEIDVIVPPWATTGEMHLNAFTRHRDPCAKIDVYRLGNTFLFEGGLAGIFKVYLNAQELDLSSTQPTNLTPNDVVTLSWRASTGPSVRVRAQLVSAGAVVWERSNLPGGFGAVPLAVPNPARQEPTMATLQLSATSNCGSTQAIKIPILLSVPPRLTIQFVEVTQGVQTDLGEVLAGRGMPMVAEKDTAVRVHLHCDRGGWFGNKLDRITGELKVDTRSLMPTNVRKLVPDKGYIGISGLSRQEFTNDTLNFTIPAAWLTPGVHSLTVRVICNDPSGRIVVGQTFNWTWHYKAPIRVRCLWLGKSFAHTGFPIEGILDFTRRTLDYLPTPLTGISVAPANPYSYDYDLTTREGWEDLLDDIEDEWGDAEDSGSGVRYLGIVHPRERKEGMNFTTIGIAGVPSVVALAMGDRPDAAAHEIGHTFGLEHINLNNPGQAAPDGPYHSADSGGMLRRSPFDVRPSEAVGLPAGDLMSYFDPVRPGITTWMRLFQMNF